MQPFEHTSHLHASASAGSEDSRWANTLALVLISMLVIAVPLVVIPVFPNFMVASKNLVVFAAAMALLGVWVWKLIRYQKLEIPHHFLVAPLVAFGLSSVLSSFLSNQYPVENLLGLGGVYIATFIIAFAGGQLLKNPSAQLFVRAMTLVGLILSITTLLQLMKVGPSLFFNGVFNTGLPNTALFNLAGSPFIAVQVLVLSLVGLVVTILTTKTKELWQMIATAVIAVGLLINAYLILPGKEAAPLLLPAGASWSIAIDVLRVPQTALIGVGPERYSNAYTQFRPMWTNGQTWWDSIFGQGRNVPLTLLATHGLVGLVSWLWLVIVFALHARSNWKTEPELTAVVAVSFILQLLFPNNVVLAVLQAAGLAFMIARRSGSEFNLHFLKITGPHGNQLSAGQIKGIQLVALGLAIAVAGLGLYGVGRAFAASNSFFRSSEALQANDAVKTYELQSRSAVLNPFVSSVCSNYALTNLAIATALSNKADITPAEKEQVAQLLQQAIREARAATLLDPSNSQNWRIMGQIYRNLIGVAEAADQWTVNSYVNAIQASPADPTLRIELGGIFYGQKQYSEAIALFQQAAQLKADMPNAYYNLANAYRQAGMLEQSKQAYQQTLALLTSDSEDYVKANQELEDLEKLLAEQQKSSGKDAVTGTANTQTLPSLTGQNLNESNSNVITQPSQEEVSLPRSTPAASASPAAAQP